LAVEHLVPVPLWHEAKAIFTQQERAALAGRRRAEGGHNLILDGLYLAAAFGEQSLVT
jgi:hypothetical protein